MVGFFLVQYFFRCRQAGYAVLFSIFHRIIQVLHVYQRDSTPRFATLPEQAIKNNKLIIPRVGLVPTTIAYTVTLLYPSLLHAFYFDLIGHKLLFLVQIWILKNKNSFIIQDHNTICIATRKIVTKKEFHSPYNIDPLPS